MQGFQAKILFNQIFLDFFIKKKFKNRNKTFIKIRKKKSKWRTGKRSNRFLDMKPNILNPNSDPVLGRIRMI